MQYAQYAPLPDTYIEFPSPDISVRIDNNLIISVTVIIRRRKSIDEALKNGARLTREEFEQEFSIPEDDYHAVIKFAAYFGITEVTIDRQRRSVELRSSTENIEMAFNTELYHCFDGKGNRYKVRQGYINVPQEVAALVEGVFGLDDRAATVASSALYNHMPFQVHSSIKGYSPIDVANAYKFPNSNNGKGECIALIELGGGYRQADLDNYFGSLGIDAPDVSWIGIDSAYNAPTFYDGYDKEVTMNIEVAGAIANGARIVVYFAPNTDKGFFEAICTAVYDKVNRPSVISISWGAAEKKWTTQSLNMYNETFKIAAILGITICVATGNFGAKNGINDGQFHVDFPASSPYVLACGGTSLILKDGRLISESAWFKSHWEGGGGGISSFFSLPDYQRNVGVPLSKNPSKFKGRGLPDVAACADPATGYKLLVHGRQTVIAGTSSVAPFYAGLIARINEEQKRAVGFINPALYSDKTLCRPIPRRNIYTGASPAYPPTDGWDPCTGLGVFSRRG